jgi:hypothetical protein
MYFSTQLQRELLLGKYPLSSLTTLEKCGVEKCGLFFFVPLSRMYGKTWG